MTDDSRDDAQPYAVTEPQGVDTEVSRPPAFKDRRAGLIVFGIVQIVMGGCCALFIPFLLLSINSGVAVGGPTTLRIVLPAIGVYAPLAVVLVWLGVGSILARRWARALSLVAAWMWLVMGVISFVTVVPMMMGMFNQPGPDRQMPPGAAMIAQAVTFAMLGFLYIVLPGMFVLFYRSPHVKATCEAADPHVRWTDRCPLPVLALSLLLGFGSLTMLTTLSYGGVLPFFGMLLKGVPAILASLLIATLFAYLAWGTYKLKMSAWWISLVAYAGFLLSSVITFTRIDLIDISRAMELPEEQLNAMQKSGMLDQMNMPVMMGIWFVATVAYLLWVRKYFSGAAASHAPA